MPEPFKAPLRTAIRTFFLEPKREYTYQEVLTLFSEMIADNIVSALCAVRNDAQFSWRDVAAEVFAEVPAGEIEDALGSDADRVLPDAYRTEIVTLRLPRHTIEELRDKAREFGLSSIADVIENQYGRGAELIEPW